MPMRLGTPFPGLSGAVEWVNSDSMPEVQEGKVTLVHFWAVSCHICHETMSDVLAMKQKYEGEGFQMIGVHMPRMESDTELDRIHKDIKEYNMTQPIAVDSNHDIASLYENEYVPAFFVFGKDGLLKFRAAGDKGFAKVEPKIREALGLPVES